MGERLVKYLSYRRIDSHNAIINIIQGGRNTGKTYGFLKKSIQFYLRTGYKFIFMRRWKVQIDKIKDSAFTKVSKEFPEHKIWVEGTKVMIAKIVVDDEGKINTESGEVCGYMLNLQFADDYKSGDLSDCRLWGFDEFIETTTRGYLPHEMETFLRMYDTADRQQNELKVYLMANAENAHNPYYQYYNVDVRTLQTGKIYKRNNGNVAIHILETPEENKKAYRKSNISKIAKEKYLGMAIENEYQDDLQAFIEPRPKGSELYMVLTSDNNSFFWVYVDRANEQFWVTVKSERHKTIRCWSINSKAPLAGCTYEQRIISTMALATQRLQVMFSDLTSRYEWYEKIMRRRYD